MTRLLFPLLLLASCAAGRHNLSSQPNDGPACMTPCGLIAKPKSCKALKAAELKILAAYAENVPEWTADEMCAAMKGWVLIVHKMKPKDEACRALYPYPDVWTFGNLCITGYTHWQIKVVEIGNEDWGHNALAHELGHVFSVSTGVGLGHCDWEARGIKAALKSATGKDDPTPSEGECDGAHYVKVPRIPFEK